MCACFKIILFLFDKFAIYCLVSNHAVMDVLRYMIIKFQLSDINRLHLPNFCPGSTQ